MLYKMKTKFHVLAVVIAALLLSFGTFAINTNEAKASTSVWKWDYNGWWYHRWNGSYPWSQWEKINGTWYHFGYWGYADCNCWLYDGVWYGLNADCSMTKGWTCGWDGTWYYCTPWGGTSVGTSGWYYPEGCMVWSDWAWINGKCYYFYGNGAMAHDTWIGDSYVGSDGAWIPPQPQPTPDPTPTPDPQPPFNPDEPAPYNPNDPELLDAVAYLNQKRAENGVSAVSLMQAPQVLAEIKAEDMMINQYYNHKCLKWGNGQAVLSDILDYWINSNYGAYGTVGGECIWCSTNENTTYRDAIDAWLASTKGHRGTLLSAYIDGFGIAKYTGTPFSTTIEGQTYEVRTTFVFYPSMKVGTHGVIAVPDDFPKSYAWYRDNAINYIH